MTKLITKMTVPTVIMASIALSLTSNTIIARSNGEGKIAQKVDELKQQNAFNKTFETFTVNGRNSNPDISKVVNNYVLISGNNMMAEIRSSQPDNLRLILPSGKGQENFSLLLFKVNISPNGFTLITSDGATQPPRTDIVNYRGIIEGDNGSIASITFSENETMGLISNKDGNYVLGKLENNTDGIHIIYNDKHLAQPFSFNCGTNTSIPMEPEPVKDYDPNQALSINCVNWYWETDYDIYVGKGNSVANVTTYLNGIFNQVSTLYANDGMSITLQTVFIWNTTDPYTGPSTGDYLDQFGAYRTSFAGNLANLLGYQGGGGVAWLNGYCASTSHKMGYCGIGSSFQNVPTYSWTVEVVAHEEGHLLGSRHTHDCVWNGNNTKIDACGDVAGYPSGSCGQPVPATPSGGGTIMSYCHLISAGINFSLGFGPQPTALMLNKINTSTCLTACSPCSPPSQPGTISGSATVCQSSSQAYSISSVSGALSYTWTLPSGWTGTSTSTSITTTAGSASGNISVVANNACGSSTARTLAIMVSTAPAIPGTISGSTSVCQSSSQTYSISSVSGATSYTWTLPAAWTGSSTTNSINATAGSAGGNITVKANNACGSSAVRTLTTTVNTLPPVPGTITASGGNTKVCPGDTKTYSISAVSGATSYTWTSPPGGTVTNGQGTTNVTINYTAGFTATDSLRVHANNSCGSSPQKGLKITRNTPAVPGIITGQIVNVCGLSNIPYSVSNVAGISYNWTFNAAGASVTSGQGSNSITTNFTAGYVSGQLWVTANNACGASNPKKLTVKATPSIPGAISGSTSVCANQQNVPYSIAPVTGAVSYTWTAPTGSRISDGTVTSTTASLTTTATSVTVNFKITAGSVKVKANNSCGAGSASSLAVAMPCREGITASTNETKFNITVYPNPVHDIVNVTFEIAEYDYALNILDVTGRTIKALSFIEAPGRRTQTIDVMELVKGVYLLELKTHTTRELVRFIKE